jgi:hypothetical protein
LVQVLEARRREAREETNRVALEGELSKARAELATVTEELRSALEEISKREEKQDPRVIFDEMKREAEWREKRGGPKSPFSERRY